MIDGSDDWPVPMIDANDDWPGPMIDENEAPGGRGGGMGAVALLHPPPLSEGKFRVTHNVSGQMLVDKLWGIP